MFLEVYLTHQVLRDCRWISYSQKLNAPLLLLWGGKDPWMNTPKKRNLYKKFTPKNTKEIILDAGHCPHDEIPELVNQHILDWVDSL